MTFIGHFTSTLQFMQRKEDGIFDVSAFCEGVNFLTNIGRVCGEKNTTGVYLYKFEKQ